MSSEFNAEFDMAFLKAAEVGVGIQFHNDVARAENGAKRIRPQHPAVHGDPL